jgi:hypothetical protein
MSRGTQIVHPSSSSTNREQKKLDKYPAVWLLFTVVVICFSGLSCATDFGVGVGADSPIDGRVKISVFEGYLQYGQPGEPIMFLFLQTERSYGCFNFSILADVDVQPGVITVRLKGIFEPEICLTALGPATCTKPLALSPGTYQLVVLNGSAYDKHTLELTATSIRLRSGGSLVSVVSSPLVWRIPVRSFAYVCGTTVETAWMCQSFRDSLLKIPFIGEFTFPDSGKIPYPTSADGYWHTEPAKYFLYAAEADYDSAGAMLKRYTRQVIGNTQGIGLSLVNWRNISFMSWVFAQNP